MITDERLIDIESLLRDAKASADKITSYKEYAFSYTMVLDELAQVGEAVPKIVEAGLDLLLEVRRLHRIASAARRVVDLSGWKRVLREYTSTMGRAELDLVKALEDL